MKYIFLYIVMGLKIQMVFTYYCVRFSSNNDGG